MTFLFQKLPSFSFVQILLINIFIIFIFAISIIFEYYGYIWHNAIFTLGYPVKGIDVSHHQGHIDWATVASTKKYSFVYIKATEGHDFVDDTFLENYTEAKKHGLFVGAYHFFSMRSSGQEQARLFLSTVPNDATLLPPVIDIELDTQLEASTVHKNITELATTLEKEYGKKPILYVTYDTYNAYVKNYFSRYNLWFRSISTPPRVHHQSWLFWQYSNRGRVSGIQTYVDINVLNSSKSSLFHLTQKDERIGTNQE